MNPAGRIWLFWICRIWRSRRIMGGAWGATQPPDDLDLITDKDFVNMCLDDFWQYHESFPDILAEILQKSTLPEVDNLLSLLEASLHLCLAESVMHSGRLWVDVMAGSTWWYLQAKDMLTQPTS